MKFESDVDHAARGTCIVGGHDLAGIAVGFTAQVEVAHIPVVTLNIHAHGARLGFDDADVRLKPEMVDFLTALGWTAPAPPAPVSLTKAAPDGVG